MKNIFILIVAVLSFTASAFAEVKSFDFDSIDENMTHFSGGKLKTAHFIFSSGIGQNFKLSVSKVEPWQAKSSTIKPTSQTFFVLNSVSTSQKIAGNFAAKQFEEFREFIDKVSKENCRAVIRVNIDTKTKEILSWTNFCK